MTLACVIGPTFGLQQTKNVVFQADLQELPEMTNDHGWHPLRLLEKWNYTT